MNHATKRIWMVSLLVWIGSCTLPSLAQGPFSGPDSQPKSQSSHPQTLKQNWGPEQATGAPDTHQAGDITTAWASLDPNGGMEWLRADFEKATSISEIHIRETFNPGAISKVIAILKSGKERLLWEGQDPTTEAPANFTVKVEGDDVVSKSIKIYLDTTRKPGWNEIDAVELIGKDTTRQWASKASASSTYAVKTSPTNRACRPSGSSTGFNHTTRPSTPAWVFQPSEPFTAVQKKRVRVHLEGGISIEGTLEQTTHEFMLIKQPEPRKTIIVNVEKIVYLETIETGCRPFNRY